jgi:hypothetical protein
MPWLTTQSDGYRGLCRWWASPEFHTILQRNKRNRGIQLFHNYDGDGHVRLAKRVV